MLFTLGATPSPVSTRGVGVVVFVATRWLTPPPARPSRRRGLDTAADLPDSPEKEHSRPAPWQRRALCCKLPLDLSDPLFFGAEERQVFEDLIVAVDTARRLCVQCPVARECLTYALTHDMRYGVWGGTSGKQREKMRVRMLAGATVEELVDECLPRPAS